MDEHKSAIPSRGNIRKDTFSDSASTLTTTSYHDPLAQLKEHELLNESYGRVQGTEYDLAGKKLDTEREMVGMMKIEIYARSREVTAREKELKEGHLYSPYVGVREYLKLALQINDQYKAERIQEEMRNVKKRRINIYSENKEQQQEGV